MMTHADVIEGAAHCGRSPRKLAYTFGGGEEAVLEEEAGQGVVQVNPAVASYQLV